MEASQKPRLFYGYIIVIACFFIMIVYWGAYYTFGIFFNSFLQEFGWSRAATSGAYSGMGIIFGLMGIPIARLSDKYGPRKVIGICGVIMGLGYILMSTINSMWQLYLFYDVMIGIGMGAYISLLPIVAKWFTRRRATMTAVLFSGLGFGAVIFPPVITWLISTYQWRPTYSILGVVIILATIIGTRFLVADPRRLGIMPYGETGINKEEFKILDFVQK